MFDILVIQRAKVKKKKTYYIKKKILKTNRLKRRNLEEQAINSR